MPSPKPAASTTAVATAFPATGTPGDPTLFTSFPFSTVGKVIFGRVTAGGTRQQEGWGSGVLVGRWLMLTAGHVVPWEYLAAGDWYVEFHPGFYNTTSATFGSADVHWWWGIEDTTPDNNDVGEITGRDYAVCALNEPLGDQCGWVGTTHLKEHRYDDYIYTSIGYPDNVSGGDVPCIETGSTILDIDNAGDGLGLETRRYPAAA